MKLGLSVGTQLTGLALMKDRSLELWRVKNFESSWSKGKLQYIVQTIERYLEDYSVTSVMLKVPEPCRSSPALGMLTEAIIRLCERKGALVDTCTSADLKKYCGARNRKEMMHWVVLKYPELTHVFGKAKRVKKVYYVRIFEAVLATMLW